MAERYVAKINLTIKDKKYKPDENINVSLSKADKDFLLREGYIKEVATTQAKKPVENKKEE